MSITRDKRQKLVNIHTMVNSLFVEMDIEHRELMDKLMERCLDIEERLEEAIKECV